MFNPPPPEVLKENSAISAEETGDPKDSPFNARSISHKGRLLRDRYMTLECGRSHYYLMPMSALRYRRLRDRKACNGCNLLLIRRRGKTRTCHWSTWRMQISVRSILWILYIDMEKFLDWMISILNRLTNHGSLVSWESTSPA